MSKDTQKSIFNFSRLFKFSQLSAQGRRNITYAFAMLVIFSLIIVLWQSAVERNIIVSFILPAPSMILRVLIQDFALILPHLLQTLKVTIAGILISITVAFVCAIVMNRYRMVHIVLYPLVLIFQIVPVIIIAPLLVVWIGYNELTQLITIILMVFFPILVTLKTGLDQVSTLQVDMLRAMGARQWQIYRWLKIPAALSLLFSGLRLAVTYGMTAAVISEWIGAVQGLGVLMIRSQKSFLIARVFAINVIIVVISVLLYVTVLYIEKKVLPWKRYISK